MNIKNRPPLYLVLKLFAAFGFVVVVAVENVDAAVDLFVVAAAQLFSEVPAAVSAALAECGCKIVVDTHSVVGAVAAAAEFD